jgi:hypothetical protein
MIAIACDKIRSSLSGRLPLRIQKGGDGRDSWALEQVHDRNFALKLPRQPALQLNRE